MRCAWCSEQYEQMWKSVERARAPTRSGTIELDAALVAILLGHHLKFDLTAWRSRWRWGRWGRWRRGFARANRCDITSAQRGRVRSIQGNLGDLWHTHSHAFSQGCRTLIVIPSVGVDSCSLACSRASQEHAARRRASKQARHGKKIAEATRLGFCSVGGILRRRERCRNGPASAGQRRRRPN